jgi:hypothetical protein
MGFEDEEATAGALARDPDLIGDSDVCGGSWASKSMSHDRVKPDKRVNLRYCDGRATGGYRVKKKP